MVCCKRRTELTWTGPSQSAFFEKQGLGANPNFGFRGKSWDGWRHTLDIHLRDNIQPKLSELGIEKGASLEMSDIFGKNVRDKHEGGLIDCTFSEEFDLACANATEKVVNIQQRQRVCPILPGWKVQCLAQRPRVWHVWNVASAPFQPDQVPTSVHLWLKVNIVKNWLISAKVVWTKSKVIKAANTLFKQKQWMVTMKKNSTVKFFFQQGTGLQVCS